MKKLLFLLATIAILGLIVSGCIAPLESVTPTSKKGNPKPELDTPKIERGVFVDHGYSSPPWYPPTEETDSYRWGPRIYWADSSLPVYVSICIGEQPSGLGTFTAIEAGFTAWDAETGTSLYGSITEDPGPKPGVVLDGKNTVQWAPIDGPSGIIGVTYYWYYTATKEMIEFDIVLDKDEPWATDGTSTAFDVQNIATHEAGHTLGLKDLPSPKDGALTMHAYTWKGDDSKRTLGSGDILGIQKIYGE
jgi:hypothetical protein